MSKENIARCPECGKKIEVEFDVELEDVVFCPECDAELVVVKLNPVKLKAAEVMLDDDDDEEIPFGTDEDLSQYYNDDRSDDYYDE
jgi:lysine biosynthesis protein LysW